MAIFVTFAQLVLIDLPDQRRVKQKVAPKELKKSLTSSESIFPVFLSAPKEHMTTLSHPKTQTSIFPAQKPSNCCVNRGQTLQEG